jgi:arginyl-tRNA--protein-N-Asp/Glu arginylyltransferase
MSARAVSLQQFSHYPAIPPPIGIELIASAPHPCPYLADRTATLRAFSATQMPAELYHRFMDAGFRRSGDVFYQPVCAGCRECRPIRIPVAQFRPSKSQRRCIRRNSDLNVSIASPKITEEKFALYARYTEIWHGRNDATFDELESFLYVSPVETLEFEYRDAGRLIAVGICDVCLDALSSVYFYFEPIEARRSLGTFGILREIEFAQQRRIRHYYLGYFVAACRSMSYKAFFRPNEILFGDGNWRDLL